MQGPTTFLGRSMGLESSKETQTTRLPPPLTPALGATRRLQMLGALLIFLRTKSLKNLVSIKMMVEPTEASVRVQRGNLAPAKGGGVHLREAAVQELEMLRMLTLQKETRLVTTVTATIRRSGNLEGTTRTTKRQDAGDLGVGHEEKDGEIGREVDPMDEPRAIDQKR